MATTPEGKVKDKIKSILKELDCWWYMPVPGGYGEQSLDFLCARKGRMFGIEAKAPGKKATALQKRTMKIMGGHEIPSRVEDGSTLSELKLWILTVTSE